MGRAPSFNSRVKQSCKLLKRVFFASLKSRSENSRHKAMPPRQTQGCSIRLSHPMKRVSKRARNAVGEQKIDVLLLNDPGDEGSCGHLSVIRPAIQFAASRQAKEYGDYASPSCPYWAASRSCILLRKLQVRLQLSRAKHRSLTRAFADGAPLRLAGAVLRIRRIAASSAPTRRPRRLPPRGAPASCGWRPYSPSASRKRPSSPAKSPAASPICSSLPATACRFNSAAYVRRHFKAGAFLESSSGVTVTDLDGNRLVRLDRLLRGQCIRLRLLQGVHRARQRAGARPGSGAGRLPSGDRLQRAAPAADFRSGGGLLPHVGHRGRHAGGAARALPHRAHPPGPLLRRLSRLVGRRAARRGQSARGPRNLYPEGHGRGELAGAAQPPRYRLCAGQPAAGIASQRQRTGRLDPHRQRTQGAFRPRRLCRVAAAIARSVQRAGHRR